MEEEKKRHDERERLNQEIENEKNRKNEENQRKSFL